MLAKSKEIHPTFAHKYPGQEQSLTIISSSLANDKQKEEKERKVKQGRLI